MVKLIETSTHYDCVNMTEFPNQEAHCVALRSQISHLSPQTALEFGLRCAGHVVAFVQPFIDLDINSVVAPMRSNWEKSRVQKEELLELLGAFESAQVKASEIYDAIEGMKDLRDATDEGIKAFRGDSAASAMTNAILGVDEVNAHLCASWAATLAWAATMFESAELKWQEDLLSELSDREQANGAKVS
jgi:hypothetical protein